MRLRFENLPLLYQFCRFSFFFPKTCFLLAFLPILLEERFCFSFPVPLFSSAFFCTTQELWDRINGQNPHEEGAKMGGGHGNGDKTPRDLPEDSPVVSVPM